MSGCGTDEQRGNLRRRVRGLLLLLAVPLLLAVAQLSRPGVAFGANVVNVTMNIPLSIALNTCTVPVEPVALNGRLHIVITTTADRKGGYHVGVDSNTESVTGTGLITGLKYTSSTEYEDEWYAGAPFPVVNTVTHNYILVSQTKTSNVIIKITFHVTVNANGVPTAAVDNLQSGCSG